MKILVFQYNILKLELIFLEVGNNKSNNGHNNFMGCHIKIVHFCAVFNFLVLLLLTYPCSSCLYFSKKNHWNITVKTCMPPHKTCSNNATERCDLFRKNRCNRLFRLGKAGVNCYESFWFYAFTFKTAIYSLIWSNSSRKLYSFLRNYKNGVF